MRDRSSIHDNTAPERWRGVAVVLAVLARHVRNKLDQREHAPRSTGGGAYLSEGASLAIGATATVSGNVPDNCYGDSPPGVVACTP